MTELVPIQPAGASPPLRIHSQITKHIIPGLAFILTNYQKNGLYRDLCQAFSEQEEAMQVLAQEKAQEYPHAGRISQAVKQLRASRDVLANLIKQVKQNQCPSYRYQQAARDQPWQFLCQSGQNQQFFISPEACSHCVYFDVEHHPHFAGQPSVHPVHPELLNVLHTALAESAFAVV